MSPGQKLKDIGRLMLLVVIGVPVTLLLLGPLLIAASVRGRLRAGPILFDFRRYEGWQRGGVIFLGVILACLIWGAAGIALINTTSPGRWFAALARRPTGPASTTVLLSPIPSPSSILTYTPAPGSIFVGVTPPPTAFPITPLPTFTSSPSPTLALVTPLPMPSPSASSTPTLRPAPASTPATVGTPVVSGTLTPAEMALIVPETIERANRLLRLAFAEPGADNMERLSAGWRDRALQKAAGLVSEVEARYHSGPLEVTYDYVITPTVVGQEAAGRIEATDRELWTYVGAISTYTETVEYRYFLEQIDGTWYIVDSRHVTWEHTP
jgi:hypothetical protein